MGSSGRAEGIRIELLAQNVALGFGDRVFASTSQTAGQSIPVAVIGQAFPYVPDRAIRARWWRDGLRNPGNANCRRDVRRAARKRERWGVRRR